MNVDSPIFNGWLNIFKEQGYTSSHVVRTIKKTFNIKKSKLWQVSTTFSNYHNEYLQVYKRS